MANLTEPELIAEALDILRKTSAFGSLVEAGATFEIGQTYNVTDDFSVYWQEGHEPRDPKTGESSTAVNLQPGNQFKVIKARSAHWFECELTKTIRLAVVGNHPKKGILVAVQNIGQCSKVDLSEGALMPTEQERIVLRGRVVVSLSSVSISLTRSSTACEEATKALKETFPQMMEAGLSHPLVLVFNKIVKELDDAAKALDKADDILAELRDAYLNEAQR